VAGSIAAVLLVTLVFVGVRACRWALALEARLAVVALARPRAAFGVIGRAAVVLARVAPAISAALITEALGRSAVVLAVVTAGGAADVATRRLGSFTLRAAGFARSALGLACSGLGGGFFAGLGSLGGGHALAGHGGGTAHGRFAVQRRSGAGGGSARLGLIRFVQAQFFAFGHGEVR